MRVISQNGLISVPFEMTAIHATGTFIRMNMVGDTGKGTIMAEYNTPGKAEKAMHILHETYSDMPVIFQNIEISDEENSKNRKYVEECHMRQNSRRAFKS